MKFILILFSVLVLFSCSKEDNNASGNTERKRQFMNFDDLQIISSAEPSDLSIKLDAKFNEYILEFLKEKEFEIIKDFKYRNKTGHFVYVEATSKDESVYFKITPNYIRANGPGLEGPLFTPISPKQVSKIKALIKKP